MRERDARQLEKLTQYVELSEEYEKKLLKLINDNEEDEENYSAGHQKSLKFNLAMVSAVNNCHSIQHIQMRDCVEDKENVFKQIHHIQESITPITKDHNRRRNTSQIFAGIKGKILAACAFVTGILIMFSTFITVWEKIQ